MPALGPQPDEFADFEQTSLPRRPSLGYHQALSVLTFVAVLFLVATLVVAALQWFTNSSSDHLILGTWQSADHPQFSTIHFTKGGTLTVMDMAGRQANVRYHFLAQYTVEFYTAEKRGAQILHTWKLRLGKEEMETTEVSSGVIGHWRRQ
jgi:hypothetical protein